MTNTAKRVDEATAWQETGTVTAAEDGAFTVRAGASTYRAKRAVGCLVAPEAGDLVLLALSARGCWVLSVLERDEGAATRLTVEGDLELSVPKGRLAVTAREGVELAAGGPLSAVAPAVRLHAPEGDVSVDRLTLLGGLVEVDASKVRVAAGAVEQTVERLTQRLGRAYRFVAELDQLRAGRIDYVAKKLLEMHGAHAAVTAEGLVKVDAEQIHVG